MQNVSSVQCYLWDILLLYVQQRDNLELAEQTCHLQASGKLMLQHFRKAQDPEAPLRELRPASIVLQMEPDGNHPQNGYDCLPQTSWYDTWADAASEAAGSPVMQLIYAGGIVTWLALGPKSGFDNGWQLDINTAVACELMLMTTFLQNTKRRHRRYMARCSRKLAALDADLEARVTTTASMGKVTAEFPVLAERPPPSAMCCLRAASRLYACVDAYACFMGSMGGVLLSLLLLGVWLGLGPVMGWGNANWWLIIGTYTGLVGFIDAFVLRNVMARQTAALRERFSALDAQDAKLAALLNTTPISAPNVASTSLFHRTSSFFSYLAGHIAAVLASVGLVVGLLICATAMGWSETAQLICNTPTMIVEGGMLLVLMAAHMASHRLARARLQSLLQRRAAFKLAADGALPAALLHAPSAALLRTPSNVPLLKVGADDHGPPS